MHRGRNVSLMPEPADDRSRSERARRDRPSGQRGAGDDRTQAGRGTGNDRTSTPRGGGRARAGRGTGGDRVSTRRGADRTQTGSPRGSDRTPAGRGTGRARPDTGHGGGGRSRASRDGGGDRGSTGRGDGTSTRRGTGGRPTSAGRGARSAPRPKTSGSGRPDRRDRTDRSRSTARPEGDRAGKRRVPGRSGAATPTGRPRAAAPTARGRATTGAGRAGERQLRERARERPERPLGPPIDEDVTGNELDAQVRRELDSLTKGHAEFVARHLVMAARAFDEDPELAYQHAAAARRRAGRVGLAREAMALAAYRTGRYAEALTEFRALRRITGSVDHWPTMADCERGLGRPRKALEMAGSSEVRKLDADGRIEMRIVAAGARRDLGQLDAALLTLRVPELSRGSGQAAARLRYAYADTLLAAGREDEALEWFHRAAAADADGATDAIERITDLEGVTFSEVDGLVDAEADVPVDGRTKISAD